MPDKSKKSVNIFLYGLTTLLLSLTPWTIFSSFFKNSKGEYSRNFLVPIQKMAGWKIVAPQNFSRIGTLFGLIVLGIALGLIGGGIIPGVALIATPAAIATIYFASLALLYVFRTLSATVGLIICKIEADKTREKKLPILDFVIYNALGYGLFGDSDFARIKKSYKEWQAEKEKKGVQKIELQRSEEKPFIPKTTAVLAEKIKDSDTFASIKAPEIPTENQSAANTTITVPEFQEIPLPSSVGMIDSTAADVQTSKILAEHQADSKNATNIPPPVPTDIFVESHKEHLASSTNAANAADILLPVNAAIPAPPKETTSPGNVSDIAQLAKPAPPTGPRTGTSAQLINIFNKEGVRPTKENKVILRYMLSLNTQLAQEEERDYLLSSKTQRIETKQGLGRIDHQIDNLLQNFKKEDPTHVALEEMKDRVSTLLDKVRGVDNSEKLFVAKKPEKGQDQTPNEEQRNDSGISLN